MAGFPVVAAQQAGLDPLAVVHHQADAVRAALEPLGARFVRQETPRGTGDAVRSSLQALPAAGTVVVLNGDSPLLQAGTLRDLVSAHAGRLVTVLTCQVPEPAAYGRLVRDAEGRALRIVEASEATPEELAIDEINTGMYALDVAWLRRALPTLRPHPPKGEIYLTDLVELAAAEGGAHAIIHPDTVEVMGVNDRWALASARRHLQRRINRAWSLAGVTLEDPDTTWIDVGVTLGADTTIGPGCVLRGDTDIGGDVQVGPHCVIKDSRVEADAEVLGHSHLEGARVESGARVGPFARLRPAARIGPGARVGNFVEVKKTHMHAGAKANHLTYLGDAEVGAGANVGAGTITCNYDGFFKHRTEIGAGAFIGSNSALVAPVRVGDGAIVGAGGVVVSDVPDDALAVARGRQSNREGAARRFRETRQAEKDARAKKEGGGS